AADLALLAQLGWGLWTALLSNDLALARSITDGLGEGPAMIQISRAGTAALAFPWALVYDIPLEGDRARHTPCRLLGDWRDRGPPVTRDAPERCPYAAEHGLNTICPFGFWGFAHVIEQPPSLRPGRSLPLAIREG